MVSRGFQALLMGLAVAALGQHSQPKPDVHNLLSDGGDDQAPRDSSGITEHVPTITSAPGLRRKDGEEKLNWTEGGWRRKRQMPGGPPNCTDRACFMSFIAGK